MKVTSVEHLMGTNHFATDKYLLVFMPNIYDVNMFSPFLTILFL